MEKFRNIKNRLSLSVDKLSPTRSNTRSPPIERKSCHLVSAPLSEGSIPASLSADPQRTSKERSRNSNGSRPSSLVESSSAEEAEGQKKDLSVATEEEYVRGSETTKVCSSEVNNESFDSLHQTFSKTESNDYSRSLVDEVLKEIDKISSITQEILKKSDDEKCNKSVQAVYSEKVLDSTDSKQQCPLQSNAKYNSLINSESTELIDSGMDESSSSSLTHEKGRSSKDRDQNAAATTCIAMHAESLTSGYFSDSASEDIGGQKAKERQARAKTASPIQRIFKSSRAKSDSSGTSAVPSLSLTKEVIQKADAPQKKESIYSRLIKSTKKEASGSKSTPKEPIYARIKPKLKLETRFKPIDPGAVKEVPSNSELLIKPEPLYRNLEAKDRLGSRSPEAQTAVSISSGSSSSHFTPVTVESSGPKEPVYSSVIPKKARSRTLPLESLYSKIKKKDPHTLPRDATAPPPILPKSKQPIYNQPLPALPSEHSDSNRNSAVKDNNYGKVTVKSREIVPSKPSVITISNPGYANTSSGTSTLPTYPPVSTVAAPSILTDNDLPPSENQQTLEENQASTETLDISQELNFDEDRSSKLSRLVEELAQELESASQRYRTSESGEYTSKTEVLTHLLSNYDVPKNLRPVEESNDDDVRFAEGALLPLSVSGDELRYMDDDENMETIYADVPNYSQDEFVIALDDENDPKYASITRNMRSQRRDGESPGKVSRRSAQVYVNVLNVLSALKVLVNSNSTKAATVISRMGTLARPYAQRVQTSLSDNTWIQRKIHRKSGHNGFDELRRYIKSGGEFCKEVAIILHERAELEATYAKGLHKLSTKLVKASREAMGTISEAWQAVGEELEHEGDIHRIFAASLTEEVVRPLRQLIETQHKVRKGIEGMVDKTSKNLHDWRAAESKAKKNCFHNSRENEKVQDMMLEARLGRGKSLSEKEMIKLEKQRRKAEDAVQKSDNEYYSYCIRTERARQEWELAVSKGSNCFQTLEEERLASLKELVEKYHRHNKETAPKLVASAARLEEPVKACNVEKDIQTIIAAKGTGENIPEQMLPDFYSEDLNIVMNKARRREALEKFLKLIRMDMERERRGKQGVENLAKALQETPNFGGEDSQQDVSDKLQNMKAMLAYLEASRYKVQSALDEVNNRPKSSHPLAKHIETHRDKFGFPVSILKVPPWVRNNSTDVSPISESPESSPNWNDRGMADGNSVQPDSDFGHISSLAASHTKINLNTHTSNKIITDNNPLLAKTYANTANSRPVARAFMAPFRYPSLILPTDEFSSQGSDHDYQITVTEAPAHLKSQNTLNKKISKTLSEDNVDSGTGSAPPDGTYYARPMTTTINPSGRCKALYDYEANMYDELSIRTGDIISIHEKQPDGWWVGELDGIVGIFPATYVEEID